METSKGHLLQQLSELTLSEQEANATGEEQSAHIKDLQGIITELQQEMSQKDQDKLGHLQQVHDLEARVKDLTKQLQDSAETIAHLRPGFTRRAANTSPQHLMAVSSDLTAARGIELLKSELSRRDASVGRLQRDLLLSHQARDSQSAQLDVQEQRLWELQRELEESRQELQRGHRRIQQLSKELQDTRRQAGDMQAQVERLSAARLTAPQQGSEEEVQKPQRRCREQEAGHQNGTQDLLRRSDEQIQQLQGEVTTLKTELSCIRQQLQKRSTELSSLQTAQQELRVREQEWQRESSSLRQQLLQTREELHSATLRAEEHRLKEVQIDELQREVDRTLALLEKDREDGSQVEELERLRVEKEQLIDKVNQGESRALELQGALERCQQDQRREAEQRAEQRELLRQAHVQLQDALHGRDLTLRSLHVQQDEIRRLQETADALRGAVVEREKRLATLSLEAESLGDDEHAHDGQAADLRRQLLTSQDALQQVTSELASTRREQECRRAGLEQKVSELQAELSQLQRQYTTCYAQLVEEETSVSRLKTEVQQVEAQRVLLVSQDQEKDSRIKQLQTQLRVLTEKHVTAQQEISSREEKLQRLAAELKSTEEQHRAAQEEVQGVKCKGLEFLALQKEVRGVQGLLNQREEELEVEKHKIVQLRLEKDSLLLQCESLRVALRGLRGEVQQWQQDARGQREGLEEEVLRLRAEVQEAQRQQMTSQERLGRELETAHRQQRDAEEEASQREAALRAQGVELARVKASLLEAQVQASDAETRLQSLSESVELYKHKYQACVNKLAQLESTLHSQQGALKEARAQVSDQREQFLGVQAEVVALRADVQGRQAQVESGDEALVALTQRLQHTQRELDECHTHAHECELVIGALRDNTAALRRQVEEKEEAVVKVQCDFSVYRATHIHSDLEYESQLSHIQELEQALSQVQERCGQREQELNECQVELKQLKEEVHRQRQLKDSSLAEMHKLQELVKQLQAEAECETQGRNVEVNTLEQRVAGLEEQLEAARKQCAQKEKAIQKRDVLLRQSEADLVRARDDLRGRAAEAEKQAEMVRSLEEELRRARKDKRRRGAELAARSTHLLQVQHELKESHATCREHVQELARLEEKAVLLKEARQCAEEQLSERVSEVVRCEQTQRSLQTELQNLQHRLHSTMQELHDSRVLLEQAKLGAQQEASNLLQEKLKLQEELARSTLTVTQLQEQLKDQSEAAQDLRAVLTQEQVKQQEKIGSLETEREQLRTDLQTSKAQLSERETLVSDLQERVYELQSATLRLQEEASCTQTQLQQYSRELESSDAHVQTLHHEARAYEGSLAEQKAKLARTQLWGQQQLDSLQSREEEVVVLKVELASVRERCNSAVAQVEMLQTQMDAATVEVEELREALVEARSDTSRLHHESELVVTNVNQWVKEQKQTHEDLGLKIRDQSKRIVHLTAENDHLQERVETLQRQIRTLHAEMDQQRMEAKRCKNSPSRSTAEQTTSDQTHDCFPSTLDLVSRAAQCRPSRSEVVRRSEIGEEDVRAERPLEGDAEVRALPGPQCASGPTRAAGEGPRGLSFSSEVIRRVSWRALERRPLRHRRQRRPDPRA